MQAQWEKLGFTPETAHDMIASRFDYSFSLPALIVTALVVIVYFVFVFRLSAKEYKDVIAERFRTGNGELQWKQHLNNFQLLEYAAWGISAVLGLWMLFDMIRTNAKYSEELLTSSREGEIEDVLVIDPPHQGGHR